MPWTAARQSPLSLEFSRQEYWNRLPRPPPGDLLNPGIKPTSLTSPALAGGFFTTSTTWEAQEEMYFVLKMLSCGEGGWMGVRAWWLQLYRHRGQGGLMEKVTFEQMFVFGCFVWLSCKACKSLVFS